ncbi:Profilin, partial [Leucoagaricus sp. SymC.cos]
YVDVQLIGTGKIARAAIIGQQGGVWAKSPGYELSLEEQKAIIGGFSNHSAVQGSGIRAAGQKFFTLQANERSIYGKKQADGIILVKTTLAVLVAEYVAPTQAGEATTVVENLADYLINLKF